jgi:hypothetical protein
VAELVFVSQIVEYSTAYRAEAAERLAALVKKSTHAALEIERTSLSHKSDVRDHQKACPSAEPAQVCIGTGRGKPHSGADRKGQRWPAGASTIK